MNLHLWAEGVIVWIVIVVAASCVTSLVAPTFQRVTSNIMPVTRSLLLLLYALIPLFVASLVVILHVNPEWVSPLVPDHCHSDTCAPHIPEIGLHSLGGTSLMVFSLVLISIFVIVATVTVIGGCHKLKLLQLLSTSHRDITYRTIQDTRPLAWCTGVFRQRIYVSTGLIQQATSSQLRAILTHEAIHKARMDNLRKSLVFFATTLWLPFFRKGFQAAFEEATEQACHSITEKQIKDNSVIASLDQLLVNANTDRERTCSAYSLESSDPKSHDQPIHTATSWLFIIGLWTLQVSAFTGSTHIVLEWLTVGGM